MGLQCAASVKVLRRRGCASWTGRGSADSDMRDAVRGECESVAAQGMRELDRARAREVLRARVREVLRHIYKHGF